MSELIFDRFLIAILIGIVAAIYSDIPRERKRADKERGEVIRASRQHCLDEVTAVIRGDDMYSGIGSDVKRAYYFAVQAASRKGK